MKEQRLSKDLGVFGISEIILLLYLPFTEHSRGVRYYVKSSTCIINTEHRKELTGGLVERHQCH